MVDLPPAPHTTNSIPPAVETSSKAAGSHGVRRIKRPSGWWIIDASNLASPCHEGVDLSPALEKIVHPPTETKYEVWLNFYV